MTMSRRRLLKTLCLSPLALSPLALSPLVITPLATVWRTASASASPSQTAPLVIHGEQGPTRFDVEIADDPQERNFGLMERESMPADHGMLFLYDAPLGVENGFWMYRTLIPLDIAFIGADGRIVDIQQMQPCKVEASSCPATQPAQAYHAALEVNAGTLEKLGVRVGDCVSWPGSNGQCG
ncbi:DUF192 domain-containing protein [Halomonas huangheensis]|uniref:DUF192 domain-containing protein n=1 Tax=Halomonas huangheensis TaxID=1178482 RepID=W1N984_9GAMM|nr:DUF192 domain-containing protein [Halomonas huangheensis]ALM53548.1 hypothetical protein AR456_15665 [Halomonas huangheensis]ERL51761.1 hypothetical protein BJB45_11390 [Halomonas huangheensis]